MTTDERLDALTQRLDDTSKSLATRYDALTNSAFKEISMIQTQIREREIAVKEIQESKT